MKFDRWKAIFVSRKIPETTRAIFEDSRDITEVLSTLDRNLTANEIEAERLRKEVLCLEEQERCEIAGIKNAGLTPRKERFALQTVRTIRRRLARLEKRLLIYQGNIDLNLGLIAKIEDMRAMQLRGVDEKHIDDIVTEFEASVEEYQDTVASVEIGEIDLQIDESDDLATLKAEICGEVRDESRQQPRDKNIHEQARQSRRQDKAPLPEIELEQ